jgi:nucleoside-diphosphate-sugar epimerase
MVSLISGINGFIGRHLADSLLQKGHKVAGIPRDLFLDTDALTHYLVEAKPDYIFHLAQYGGQKGQTDIDQTIVTNIFNTYLLLKYSEQIPYQAFVYVGSSSEYGKKEKAMKENDVLEPDTPYAITKACGDLITRMFVKPIVTVRPFSVFGEGERETRFIPTVIKHLKSGEPIEISPTPRHDWMYVRDVAEAFIKVAENAGGLIHKVVNIGTGHQATNLEIIRLLEKISNKKLNFTEVPKQKPQDSDHWVANTEILDSLGFEEVYGVRCGLKKTYDYY